jgi:glycine/D-amino acid oxidase-like deaminating enzyme
MPIIDRITTDTKLPRKTTVVVIGGGIIGVSTALELAERGVPVVLLEKGIIAGEQSSRNWGWCRQMGRDHSEIPLILESMKLWRGMNERIGSETGYRQCGILYLAATQAEAAVDDKWYKENVGQYGLETRQVTSAEINSLQPGAARNWHSALYTSTDGRAEPFIAVPAMARYAQKRGVTLIQNCAVRGVELAAGRIASAITEHGAISCEQVVLAGGAWSRRFLHNIGITFPQLTVIGSVMRTAALETGLDVSCAGARFSFRKRLDGGYTVTHADASTFDIVPDSFRFLPKFLPALKSDWRSLRARVGRKFVDEAMMKRRWKLDERSPFEDIRILDPEPVEAILAEAAASLKSYYPAFSGMQIVERWAGAIDVTPDAVPVISEISATPGLYLASGFSGHGFGLGPGAGKLMAQILTGEKPCVDPKVFRFERY